MPKYTIVAESGADVPPKLAEHFGITIVPMYISLGRDTYKDGILSLEETFSYYEKTRKLPTTSGCSPTDFTEAFDAIHKADPTTQIIHLAYSAITTNSYQSALTAAEGRDYVHHYDTKTVSLGQAMVVLGVAEFLSDNPNVELDELERVIADRIERSRLGFLPGDLSYLRAGGRLSNASYLGAQLLKVIPFVELIDGKLIASKMYRGSMLRVAQKMLGEFLGKHTFDNKYFYLLSSPGLKQEIMDIAEELVQNMGIPYTGWLQPGCVVSCHGGPKAFGIAGLLKA